MKIAYIDHNYPDNYSVQRLIRKLKEKGVEVIAAQTFGDFQEINSGTNETLDGLLIHPGLYQQKYLQEVLSNFKGVPHAIVTWSVRHYNNNEHKVFDYKYPHEIFEYFKKRAKENCT